MKSPFSYGKSGFVEMTPELGDLQRAFVNRAAKLIGSAGAHEKALSQLAAKLAHQHAATKTPVAEAAADLIKQAFAAGNATFKLVAPNYLMRLHDGVPDLKIGSVRVMRTADFAAEEAKEAPDAAFKILPGEGFSLFMGEKSYVTMHPLCWVVEVDAINENVAEEGKWLIDVAVSYFRLSYSSWQGLVPVMGDTEPHPLRATPIEDETVKYEGTTAHIGGGKTPGWYEIDEKVHARSLEPDFSADAALISNPPSKSLAERVSQGLGWLTRGRQAQDRAERLLFFFTAIEALLSSDDKTAPVTQTIARHAGVLLSNDHAVRADIASKIGKLYAVRSALVHQGNRSVFWSVANNAQVLAESLYWVVLHQADLKTPHKAFSSEVSRLSYGLPWQPAPKA